MESDGVNIVSDYFDSEKIRSYKGTMGVVDIAASITPTVVSAAVFVREAAEAVGLRSTVSDSGPVVQEGVPLRSTDVWLRILKMTNAPKTDKLAGILGDLAPDSLELAIGESFYQGNFYCTLQLQTVADGTSVMECAPTRCNGQAKEQFRDVHARDPIWGQMVMLENALEKLESGELKWCARACESPCAPIVICWI
jgi:hypothetical protein